MNFAELGSQTEKKRGRRRRRADEEQTQPHVQIYSMFTTLECIKPKQQRQRERENVEQQDSTVTQKWRREKEGTKWQRKTELKNGRIRRYANQSLSP